MTKGNLYGTRSIAEFAGVSHTTVYNAIGSSEIKGRNDRIKGRMTFVARKSEVRRWMAARKRKKTKAVTEQLQRVQRRLEQLSGE